MANYLMGMDYGTGGAKVCIIDEEANILSYAFREYPIYTDKPDWSEHDANLYWEHTCDMIKECIEKANINPKDIKGIGTSSALPSMVMVDKDYKPINRAYNLMDRRAKKEVQWLRENIGQEEIFKISGNRLEDHPSIVNLMWEKNNRPEDFKRIYKALTIDGFIRLKLTGKATASYSAGAFYGVAYNVFSNQFEKELMDKIGISIDLMPEVYRCEEIIGEVTYEAAKETGLAEGIAVAAGQVDCNAGWVGAGATQVGDVQMNLGTCGNFGVIHKDPNFLDSMISCAYTIDSENTYITVPTTTTGGQSLRYLRDQFSHMERAMEKLVPNFDAYDYLNMEAEKINIGSDGLIILPYLMGERTPIWDVDAKGVIFGLSLNHTKGHLVRAMMEAVAYALYDSFVLLKEKNIKINSPIVLNEGGAKSKLWRSIITDVFNVPTALVKSRVGAPFGDAILAGVAVGIFKDFSIAKEKTEYIDLIEPNQKNHEIYMEYFKLYKKLYEDIKEDYKALAHLRNLSSQN
ncbi:FGGY-family carbohydrate kinase [Defluviitalea saccharophila]|uniref:FGGY-family carbohydrate kinase n=1 Tax=Defluviitalea saccharophila TaxID=879970 RepID=A0ABZ2Y100_9FIRM